MKQISILFFTLLLLGACVKAPTQTDNFVKIVDGRFSVNDKPYYYIGTNFWYAAILGSQGQGGNRERLLKELDFMKANGITNLRVLVGADGIDGIMTKAEPALQTAPGVYNDTIFDGLDFFLSELGKSPEDIHNTSIGVVMVKYLCLKWQDGMPFQTMLLSMQNQRKPINYLRIMYVRL